MAWTTAAEWLLALAVGVPAALALFWPVRALRGLLVAVAPWAAVPALALAVHPRVVGTGVSIPALFTGLHLEVDEVGRGFLVLTALLWVAAGAFARSYHAGDARREAFFGFFVLTMTGNLGLVLAGDVLSFYLFFACMTFAAYGLVIHRRDREAMRAGRVYIVMAVLGELCILAAVVALGWAAGTAGAVPLFGPALDAAWVDLAAFGFAGGVALLVVVGFGIKAGLAPLHLWLPLAHPVAPTAASALLSGAMIKAGLLAWLRFLPVAEPLPEVGALLVGLGVATAFYGVLVGLTQDDPKTILAYSSVSQMGYMAVGAGLLLRVPGWSAVALLAVVFYALQHGVAKGALFLAVGVGDRAPAGPGASRWRMAVLVGAAVSALALAGAPFTAGARAKAVLKAGLSELEPGWYAALDPVLLVAAAGTTLLMARFLVALDGRMGAGGAAPWGLAVPWGVLVAVGAVGALWLPLAYAVPEGVELPGLLYGLGGAAGPVITGGVVAWMVWRRPGLAEALARIRIPAGDLVVPLERAIQGAWRPPLEKGVAAASRRLRRLRKTQLWSHARAVWPAERDLYMARGPAVAILLLVLILGLVGLLV